MYHEGFEQECCGAIGEVSGDPKPDLVNLQMILVTSSLNHEYATQELDRARSYTQRQELMERLSHLKSLYFAARRRLFYYNPDKVEQIEKELRIQKQNLFNEYLA